MMFLERAHQGGRAGQLPHVGQLTYVTWPSGRLSFAIWTFQYKCFNIKKFSYIISFANDV